MIEERNPEGTPGIMKVISTKGEGLRAKMLALSKNKKQAIVLLLNAPFHGFEKWGMLVLVKEIKATEWPVVVKKVDCVPNSKNWRMPENVLKAMGENVLKAMGKSKSVFSKFMCPKCDKPTIDCTCGCGLVEIIEDD